MRWVATLARGRGIWLLLSSALLAGCSPTSPAPSGPAPLVAERGPIRLEMRLSAETIRIGDTVTASLEATTPPDFELDFADFALPVDAEKIAATDEAMSLDEAGNRHWRMSATFEPTASGEVELPAQTARYRRQTNDAASQPGEWSDLTLAATKLTVQSELSDADQTDQPRAITGILAAPPVRLKPWQIAAITIGVVAAIALLVWLIRMIRRRWNRPAPPIAAELWALHELERLAAVPPRDAEATRSFYYTVSGVVREYIERKFTLRAPEMTTEEFLRSLVSDDRSRELREALNPDQLRPFLEACDAVKYAALRPGAQEAADSVAAARAFVHRSAASYAEFERRRELAAEQPMKGAA